MLIHCILDHSDPESKSGGSHFSLYNYCCKQDLFWFFLELSFFCIFYLSLKRWKINPQSFLILVTYSPSTYPDMYFWHIKVEVKKSLRWLLIELINFWSLSFFRWQKLQSNSKRVTNSDAVPLTQPPSDSQTLNSQPEVGSQLSLKSKVISHH